MTVALIVDDEAQIRRALRAGLEARGFTVMEAVDGRQALELATGSPEVIVLDLGLPDIDGTDVIARVRVGSQVPIIVLSVRDGQADKVSALEAGADDYVTKPFDMPELVARIRAALRRAQPTPLASPLRFGPVEVDPAGKVVRLSGEPVHLTPTEYALLEAMATHPGKLLTHRWLLQSVWGAGYGDETHYLHVYVRQLRRKLADDTGMPRLIITEPGIGYRWAGGDQS